MTAKKHWLETDGPNKKLGKIIAEKFTALNIMKVDFAIDLGVSTVTVDRWLSGESNPTFNNLKKLAKKFGMTLKELMPEED